MAGEIVPPEGIEGEDYFVIEKRGNNIVVPIHREGTDYHPDPQVRAYQLVYEGRLGGARQPGRRNSKRASQDIAREVRDRLTPKLIKVLDRGLRKDAGINANLAAFRAALAVEHDEAELALKEEEADLSKASREELLDTLVALLKDPSTEAAVEGAIIEGSGYEVEAGEEDGQAEAVTNGYNGNSAPGEPPVRREREVHERAGSERNGEGGEGGRAVRKPVVRNRATADSGANGLDSGEAAPSRRRASAANRLGSPDSLIESAKRRAAERRRASRLDQD